MRARNPFLAILIALTAALACTARLHAQPANEAGQERTAANPAGVAHEFVLEPEGFRGQVLGVAFSPDDKWVAAVSTGEVRVWDVASGQMKQTMRGDRNLFGSGNLLCIAASPDGHELLVGTNHIEKAGGESTGVIRVYSDMQRLSALNEVVPATRGIVIRLAFSHDGQTLAAVVFNGKTQELLIWDWPNRKITRTVPMEGIYTVDLAFLSEEPTVYAFVHDPKKGSGPHVYSIREARWLEDIGELARISRADEQAVNLFLEIDKSVQNADKGKLKFPEGWNRRGPNGMHLAYRQRTFLASSVSVVNGIASYWVSAWDAQSMQPIARYGGHPWFPEMIALSHYGDKVVSADWTGEVHLWDVHTGKPLHRLRTRGMKYYDAALSADASKLYLATKPYSGSEFRTNHYGAFNFVFDFRARKLSPLRSPAAANVPPVPESLGNLSVRLVQDQGRSRALTRSGGREIARFDPISEPSTFSVLPRSDLGIRYAVAFGNSTANVRVCDAQTGRVIFDAVSGQHGHCGFVASVRASPNGKFLLSASTDCTVRLWSLQKVGSGPASGSIRLPSVNAFITDEAEWLLWTPQGYYDASPGAERFLNVQTSYGKDQQAQVVGVASHKDTYHRPDIINRLLETGDLDAVVREVQK